MSYSTIHFEDIDSTSTYIKNNYHSLSSFTFVSADYQSKGRGREERTWYSAKKENLMFSFLIKEESLIKKYMDLSLASAYVLAKVIDDLFPSLHPQIKWPNDVYIQGKKMSGILLESHMEEGRIDGIIIGIGINVNQTEFPPSLLFPVTSLKKELSADVSVEDFKKKLFDEIYDYFPLIALGRKDHIEYSSHHNYLAGKTVQAIVKGERKDVTVLSINDDCSLRVLVDDKEMNLISGEITFHKE